MILSDKTHRKYILENSRFIPQKLPAELQRVVITKDLIPAQRQERKDRRQTKRGSQGPVVASQSNKTARREARSPIATETGGRTPSPITTEQPALSQLNQDGQIFDETTIIDLEATVVGGRTVGTNATEYTFDDPGPPV